MKIILPDFCWNAPNIAGTSGYNYSTKFASKGSFDLPLFPPPTLPSFDRLADRVHLLWHEMVLLLVRCPEISRCVPEPKTRLPCIRCSLAETRAKENWNKTTTRSNHTHLRTMQIVLNECNMIISNILNNNSVKI